MIGALGGLVYSDRAGSSPTLAAFVVLEKRSDRGALFKSSANAHSAFVKFLIESVQTDPNRSKEKQPIHGNHL